MGSCSAERGQEVVYLVMPQRVLPHHSSGWVSTLWLRPRPQGS